MRTIYRDIVGAFILSADNRLLLGKGGVYADSWIVPGGGIEKNETKPDAIKREVAEETGIDISEGIFDQVEGAMTGESEKTLRDTGEHVLVKMTFYNFTVKLPMPADKIALRTDDDFKEARWVPIKDLPTISLSPPSITTLQKLGYL
jgi:8-oxo-dGTP pyrophosphatase MutT (NUDIX family)